MRNCHEAGIGANDAIKAETECKVWYTSWWRGNRFTKSKPATIPDDELSDEDMEDFCENENDTSDIQYPHFNPNSMKLESVKMTLISVIKNEKSLRPEENPRFLDLLKILESKYRSTNIDARDDTGLFDSTWCSITGASRFQECLGQNVKGDDMYTLGRMSFDMFRPNNLPCSIQWVFNSVTPIGGGQGNPNAQTIPRSLQKEVLHGQGRLLRSHDISTAFTVEDDQSSTSSGPPLRGLMSTFGFTLPDPSVHNRLTVWFTGGLLEEVPHKTQKSFPSEHWKRIFSNPGQRTVGSWARIIAANLLLGINTADCMDEVDGSLEYRFSRPLGGHGRAYLDILYLDRDLRIMRGHHGTIYVCCRTDRSHIFMQSC